MGTGRFVPGIWILAAAQGVAPPGTDSVRSVLPELSPPAGAVESPVAASRLDLLRTSRWISAGASRTRASLDDVREHFRREERRWEAARPPRLHGRLQEWLERHPSEMTKYREFERAQSSAAAGPEWEIRRLPAAEIPLHLGGGEPFGGLRFRGRTVAVSFGSILLPDSVVRVQLLSPYPSDDGKELVGGTLVAWIREIRDDPLAAATPSAETVDGPETAGLSRKVPGWLVMDEPVGGLIALGVPALSRSDVRPRGTAASVVHTVAGPDGQGRLVYVENRAAEGRHALKLVQVDGRGEEVVFSRPGEAFFEMAVGSSLALSPTGGRVALLSRLTRFQTGRPGFPLRMGTLEIWDLEKRSGRALDVLALDRRLSWFPDGRRLAYVELVPIAKAVFPSDSADDGFGATFRSWEAVPVVRLLEADSERRRSLHVGWDPVVSSDGTRVLLRDADNRWRLVDVDTGRSRPVAWPGDAGGAIALTGEGLVVYWGLPTSGSAPDFTRTYSTAMGPRPMKTIKVAELSSQRFETLVPSVDPRREISFGLAAAR